MPEDAWPRSRPQYWTWQFPSSLAVLTAPLGRSRREPSVVPAHKKRAGRGFPHACFRAPLAFGDRCAPPGSSRNHPTSARHAKLDVGGISERILDFDDRLSLIGHEKSRPRRRYPPFSKYRRE